MKRMSISLMERAKQNEIYIYNFLGLRVDIGHEFLSILMALSLV